VLATILVEPGRTKLIEIARPTPDRGEVLVKIKAALTCGTDLKAFKRGHPVIPMPGVFGHEFSGVVAETGKGIKKFRVGDEIMSVHSAPCLECRYCKTNLFNLCERIMYTKILGAFAEYILLPSHIVKQNAFLKPKNLSFEEASFLEPLSCVVHGMASLNIRKGDQALVIGAGPIGLLHLLLLKSKGALVTVMDKHQVKLRTAKKLGADVVVISNPPSPPFSKVGNKGTTTRSDPTYGKSSSSHLPVENLSSSSSCFKNFASSIPPFEKGGQGGILQTNKSDDFIGFDYVFECTGIPEVWGASVDYLRRGGTVVLFGGCKSGTKVTYDAGRIHYDEITLKGVFHYTPADVRKAYELLVKGHIDVKYLISGRYPLQHTQKAFEKLSKGKGIKYAIIP
jgi:L-iditol 2-dehydrogenase